MQVNKLIEKYSESKPKRQTVTFRVEEGMYQWMQKQSKDQKIPLQRIMEAALRLLREKAGE